MINCGCSLVEKPLVIRVQTIVQYVQTKARFMNGLLHRELLHQIMRRTQDIMNQIPHFIAGYVHLVLAMPTAYAMQTVRSIGTATLSVKSVWRRALVLKVANNLVERGT